MAIRCFYLRLQSGGKIQLRGGGYLRLHIECITVGGGLGKRSPYRKPPLPEWYVDRTRKGYDRIAEEVRAAKERERRDEQAIAKRKEALDDNFIMLVAHEAVEQLLEEEEKERQNKREHRGRAFFALEMGKASAEGIRDISNEDLIREHAQRTVSGLLKAGDKTANRQAAIKKQRLLNLEKAKMAKEKKAKKKEEIKQQRLKNLKKARATKKRKRKKKK